MKLTTCKPQFSLIGDTVNTTSRVCSTSKQGRVTVSEKVYEIIRYLADFEFL